MRILLMCMQKLHYSLSQFHQPFSINEESCKEIFVQIKPLPPLQGNYRFFRT